MIRIATEGYRTYYTSNTGSLGNLYCILTYAMFIVVPFIICFQKRGTRHLPGPNLQTSGSANRSTTSSQRWITPPRL